MCSNRLHLILPPISHTLQWAVMGNIVTISETRNTKQKKLNQWKPIQCKKGTKLKVGSTERNLWPRVWTVVCCLSPELVFRITRDVTDKWSHWLLSDPTHQIEINNNSQPSPCISTGRGAPTPPGTATSTTSPGWAECPRRYQRLVLSNNRISFVQTICFY